MSASAIPVTPATVADTLTCAAALIESTPKLARGLYVERLTDPATGRETECFCTLGAIREVLGFDHHHLQKAAQAHLATHLHLDGDDGLTEAEITEWNDASSRTQAEVVAALRAAAASPVTAA